MKNPLQLITEKDGLCLLRVNPYYTGTIVDSSFNLSGVSSLFRRRWSQGLPSVAWSYLKKNELFACRILHWICLCYRTCFICLCYRALKYFWVWSIQLTLTWCWSTCYNPLVKINCTMLIVLDTTVSILDSRSFPLYVIGEYFTILVLKLHASCNNLALKRLIVNNSYFKQFTEMSS